MIDITDSMVEAAARSAYGVSFERYRKMMRRALEAAVAAAPLESVAFDSAGRVVAVGAEADDLMLQATRESQGQPVDAEPRAVMRANHVLELARVLREGDNLQARLTAVSKSLVEAHDAIGWIASRIDDEGDRSYFRSTNDADALRKTAADLEEWVWDDIIADGKLTDIYETSRKAHEIARRLLAALEAMASLYASDMNGDPCGGNPEIADEMIEARRLIAEHKGKI